MAALVLAVSLSEAAAPAPATPGEQDKCAVCKMFVARCPNTMARIVFKDGSNAFFCGVKCMMKYYFEPVKYNPSKKTADINAVVVTDYSNQEPIDGLQAYYVAGSVVFGPMGLEFMPFAVESAAREFMQENSGKEIVRFNQINLEKLKMLLEKY